MDRQIAPPGIAATRHHHTCDDVLIMMEAGRRVETSCSAIDAMPVDAVPLSAWVTRQLTNTGMIDAQRFIDSRSRPRLCLPDGAAAPVPDWTQ